VLNFTRALTVPSALAYAAWIFRGRAGPVQLALRRGPRIEIRPTAFGALGNNDYGVAYEVYISRTYELAERLDPERVELVVDMGANVGFSVLLWLTRFRRCQVIAFEPHPGHAAQLRRHLDLNDAAGRVILHEAAAGSSERDLVLTDLGSSSTVLESGEGLPVRVVDVFPLLVNRRIDLMKVDIEGGEYEILEDPRFVTLDVRALIMEWHKREQRGRRDVLDRLAALGFRTQEFGDEGTHGMLWATRD
jgi:FkbM family methyltransferase